MLREELTVGQISSKHEIHPTQLHRWKKAVLEGLPELLSDNRRRDSLIKEHDEEVKGLYAQIGELTSKLSWHKKKSGIDIK
jgi:transposase-like protein